MSEYLYVCHFSNGHIKVGRSISPKSRIAQHADRVACIGVELVEHHIVECVGHSAPAEAALIERCAELASRRNKNEWFEGLEYTDVCQIADETSVKDFTGEFLVAGKNTNKSALKTYLEGLPRGGISEFAEKCGISPVYLSQLAAEQDDRVPSAELCVVIERESDINVRRQELRPKNWHLIWPELAEKAPA